MSIREQVLKRQYARVPTRISRERLEDAAKCFLDFLALPDEIKRALHFSSDVPRGTAGGYTDKRNVPGKDPKELFHWYPGISGHEIYRAIEIEYPIAAHFFAKASTIYTLAEYLAWEVISREFAELYEHAFVNGHRGTTFSAANNTNPT